MQSDMILTLEYTMTIDKDVGQLNAIEKFHCRDPELEVCSAYWVWTIMLIRQM